MPKKIPELKPDKYSELEKRYEKLKSVFEEILKDKFVISELRDFWRNRAGIK